MTPDFFYFKHNQTIAIKPNADGRFKDLVRTGEDGEDLVWVFRGPAGSQSRHEKTPLGQCCRIDRSFSYLCDGLVIGDYWQGETFLDDCRELGLVVESQKMWVPLANGPTWSCRGPKGESFVTYSPEEAKRVRTEILTIVGHHLVVDCVRLSCCYVFDGQTKTLDWWDRGAAWAVWYLNKKTRDPSANGACLPRWLQK